MAASAIELGNREQLDLENNNGYSERVQWVLNAPEPPSLGHELKDSVKESIMPKVKRLKMQPWTKSLVTIIQGIFPILSWAGKYKPAKFKNDLMAGLTLASLCIPQSIGYAILANLNPKYGLYTSVVPPLIYATMGTSRDLAIGPVAVVSLLLASLLNSIEDPETNPVAYTNLVLTATFFAGVFQAAFGLFRLGFLVDFLSHAATVGFMAGAAIIIGLQQLKDLLGLDKFTHKTDIVSVMKSVFSAVGHPWNPHNCILGTSFLCFILITRFVGKRNKKFYWLPALSPLLSVILSTAMVYLTKGEDHGIKIVKHIEGGLNPSSIHQLQFTGPHVGKIAKAGLIAGIIALTEAIAVGRSFASVKGYQLDGNKEMIAMGFMNIVGSLTSCYVATGSFSRSAVNFSAGCETLVSNIVMALTVFLSLEFLTKLLYFTPKAILASIIISALPGLIDIHEAYSIWKVDKFDFLACIGAFFGVLFVDVEIGLLIAVAISFLKIIYASIQPGIQALGKLPGTNTFSDANQYPMAVRSPGVLTIRIKSALLCFANANFITERIMKLTTEEGNTKTNVEKRIKLVVLDLSSIVDIDTSGIASLEELHKNLASHEVELAIANPRWQVLHKLRLADFVRKIDGRFFLTVEEAVDAYLITKLATT